jgi:hypothetical protein
MAKKVFFSFHYDRDAWRVQQVINMGALEEQAILNAQKWEEVKRQGNAAIEKWIADQMAYKSAAVVLVGRETADRPWVKHEIAYAWDHRKPLVGIRIHGLANKEGKTDSAGGNPFSKVELKGGGNVGQYVPLYTPTGSNSQAVYGDIKKNLTAWVDGSYQRS